MSIICPQCESMYLDNENGYCEWCDDFFALLTEDE